MSVSYVFKVFSDGSYSNESSNLISVKLDSKDFNETWDFLKISNIAEVSISNRTLILLKSLISKFDISSFETLLLNIGVNLQNAFIEYQDSYNDIILDDFKKEDNEYRNLLNIIEEYFFNSSNELNSISFNFNKKNFPISPFKNQSVLTDIMNGVTKYLDINVENFHSRKKQILEDTIQIKKGKGDEFIRTRLVQELFKFFKTQKPELSDNSTLQFIGCFLHIFQIPSNSTITEIQINSIEEEIKSIDVNLMRFYIDRPKSIFTK